MLRRAVTLGPRIGVMMALTSTVEPSTRLLAEEVDVSVAEEAWDAFMAGDAPNPLLNGRGL